MADPVTTTVESVSWWIQIWDVRDAVLGAALAVVAASAAVVGGTKTPTPGSWLGRIYKIIESADGCPRTRGPRFSHGTTSPRRMESHRKSA